jgi:hypothetical protein
MASELSRSAKEDLLAELAGIPFRLEEVGHAQSSLPRGKGKRNTSTHHDITTADDTRYPAEPGP